MASQAATLMDEHDEEQKPWEETPDTRFSVGATAGLSNKPGRHTVGDETQDQEEAGIQVHVNTCVANLGLEPHTCCNLVGAKVTNTNCTGSNISATVSLECGHLFLTAKRPDGGTEESGADRGAAGPGEEADVSTTEGPEGGAGEGDATRGAEGDGEKEEEGKDREPEVEGMSFPNTKGAMVNEDDEVEVVEDDQEVQVVDMSMEEQPHSPEEAGANARSPSPSPESPTPGPMGFCRDELYETNEEAEMMLDEAEEGEGRTGEPALCGARSPVSIPHNTCIRVHTGARSK